MFKNFKVSTSIFVVLFFLNTYICRIPRWMGVRLGICVSWTYALDEIYDWMKRRLFIRLDLTVCLQMFSLIRKKKLNKNSRCSPLFWVLTEKPWLKSMFFWNFLYGLFLKGTVQIFQISEFRFWGSLLNQPRKGDNCCG